MWFVKIKWGFGKNLSRCNEWKNTKRNGWNYQRKTRFYHAGTNEPTNNINLLISAKKLVKKIRDTLPATKIAFSSIVLHKDRRNINESRTDFNAKLCNFCKQKNIGFIDTGNINESHLGMKKVNLNRKGNFDLAKNLLNYLENYWREVSESDLFLNECIPDSSEIE